MMDDALLAGERAKAKKPDNWDIVSRSLRKPMVACCVKDDPQFKKLMDDTIAQVQTSGEAENGLINGSKIPFARKT